MSKSSKSCGYTGHMHTMNRVNQTKAQYDSQVAKVHENQHQSNKAEKQDKCTCPKK